MLFTGYDYNLSKIATRCVYKIIKKLSDYNKLFILIEKLKTLFNHEDLFLRGTTVKCIF